MKASVITIGDELLIGQTINTNAAWIGAELSSSGFDILRMTTIHDRREDIIYALTEAASKSDVVLITGGLGPTSDDITKQTLCEYFNTSLVTSEVVLKMIGDMINQRKMTMNENNRKQADVPESCRVLTNATGTAPGMWFEKDNTVYISMPGVPYEMKHIMTEHVLPELNKRFRSQIIIHKYIMTYGTSEAKLAELLVGFEEELPERIKLAYLPAWGIIKLRLTVTGDKQEELQEMIAVQVRKLYQVLPEYVYGENEDSFEMVIGRLLRSAGKTLCTAESCTGGAIASMITSVSGSSGYYKGSVVAYSNSVKTQLLGVKQEVIDANGAVSEIIAKDMATGVRELFNTDFAVAITGIAGPEGGSDAKPVGTVWIAVASGKGTVTEKRVFGSDRVANIKRFSLAALNLLRKQIINE